MPHSVEMDVNPVNKARIRLTCISLVGERTLILALTLRDLIRVGIV